MRHATMARRDARLQRLSPHFGSYRGRYGSIGAVIVLQIWLFLSGYVVLFGAKLNTELMRSAGVAESEQAAARG